MKNPAEGKRISITSTRAMKEILCGLFSREDEGWSCGDIRCGECMFLHTNKDDEFLSWFREAVEKGNIVIQGINDA